MTRTDLRTWAESLAPAGSVQAQQVLALLAERDALLETLALRDALVRGLCDRVEAQSQILAARADRPLVG